MSSPVRDATGADPGDSVIELQAGDLVELPAGAADHEADGSRDAKRKVSEPTYHWMILGLCVTVLLLSLMLTVRDHRQVLVPLLGKPLPELCHMKRYTGVDCPGCGLTRSFISLAHGRLAEAWRYNPGAFILFPIMLFQIPYRSVQLWRHRRGLPFFQLGWLGTLSLWLVIGVVTAQWALRQLGVAI